MMLKLFSTWFGTHLSTAEPPADDDNIVTLSLIMVFCFVFIFFFFWGRRQQFCFFVRLL
jgi:hypothetical protein